MPTDRPVEIGMDSVRRAQIEYLGVAYTVYCMECMSSAHELHYVGAIETKFWNAMPSAMLITTLSW